MYQVLTTLPESPFETDIGYQVVFLIDLPRKPQGSADTSSPPFLEELKYFMKASKFHDNIIAKLGDFDFSQTADYAFVHTM